MIDGMGLADQTIVAIVNWNRLVRIGLDRRHQIIVVLSGRIMSRKKAIVPTFSLTEANDGGGGNGGGGIEVDGGGDPVRAYSM